MGGFRGDSCGFQFGATALFSSLIRAPRKLTQKLGFAVGPRGHLEIPSREVAVREVVMASDDTV